MYPVWYPLKCLDYAKKGTNMVSDNDITAQNAKYISMHITQYHCISVTVLLPRATVTKTYQVSVT